MLEGDVKMGGAYHRSKEKKLTVSISIKNVDKSRSNSREETGESALELFEVQLSIAVLVELVELAGSVAAHEIEVGVFVERCFGDLQAALPNDLLIGVRATGAHVKSIIHRFVEFAVPLKMV